MMTATDKEAAIDWLFTGDVGLSSQTLCGAFLDKGCPNPWLPSDPDDLCRCREFLKRLSPIGQSEALLAVCKRYADWVPLVREWDSLCALMDKEAPNWDRRGASAPKTYHRMKLLQVEGLKLRYPKATITLHKDGTLASMMDTGE